jgi:predicted TIM-barrel fold metal-dependent hydrolase
MPLQNAPAAVAEMRRVVKGTQLPGGLHPPESLHASPFVRPACDIFWREAQDLPLAIHSSFGTKMPALGADRYLNATFALHMFCHPFEQHSACMDVICGGVLERFPPLRIAFLEAGVGWAGYWRDRMDGPTRRWARWHRGSKKRPTEYFIENCYLSLDPDECTLAAMRELGLDRNILWGSDSSHFAHLPWRRQAGRPSACDSAEAARYNIITANPIRFYKLDG